MSQESHYLEQAKKDVVTVISMLEKHKFSQVGHFSQELNESIKEQVVSDQKGNTKLFVDQLSIKQSKVNKFLFSFRHKGETRISVTVGIKWYWMVNGQKSSIPDMVEWDNEYPEIDELDFDLTYKENRLIGFSDHAVGFLLFTV